MSAAPASGTPQYKVQVFLYDLRYDEQRVTDTQSNATTRGQTALLHWHLIRI